MPPVNGLVTQRAGRLKTVSSFNDLYGLKGLSIASGAVYAGLAAFAGLDFMKVTDSGDPGKDMGERLAIAHKAMKDYDFIHVHTKTPDEAAHTKKPMTKNPQE